MSYKTSGTVFPAPLLALLNRVMSAILIIASVVQAFLSAKPHLCKGAELPSAGRQEHHWLPGSLYIPEIFSILHLLLKAKDWCYNWYHVCTQNIKCFKTLIQCKLGPEINFREHSRVKNGYFSSSLGICIVINLYYILSLHRIWLWNIKSFVMGKNICLCLLFGWALLWIHCVSISRVAKVITVQTVLYHFLDFRYMLITSGILMSDSIDSLDHNLVLFITSQKQSLLHTRYKGDYS